MEVRSWRLGVLLASFQEHWTGTSRAVGTRLKKSTRKGPLPNIACTAAANIYGYESSTELEADEQNLPSSYTIKLLPP